MVYEHRAHCRPHPFTHPSCSLPPLAPLVHQLALIPSILLSLVLLPLSVQPCSGGLSEASIAAALSPSRSPAAPLLAILEGCDISARLIPAKSAVSCSPAVFRMHKTSSRSLCRARARARLLARSLRVPERHRER